MTAAQALAPTADAIRVAWAASTAETGNGMGYTRMSRALQAAFVEAGGVIDQDAELALHVTYAPHFQPIPGRRNALMTMWESEPVPAPFVAALQRADAIIAPSRWVADVMRRAAQVPCVWIVPLGIDPKLWLRVVRHPPQKRPFRWLWVGAHNHRKGWLHVTEAWKLGFLGRTDCELYLKTTEIDPEYVAALAAGYSIPAGSVRRQNNVVLDTRKVSDAELFQLYAQADGFVLPHMGEGYGCTLSEAMATALPCVSILTTGVTQFADASVCRPVTWHYEDVQVCPVAGDAIVTVRTCSADIPDLVAQMAWVMAHPIKARELGLRASKRVHGQHTWGEAGRRLLRAVGEITSG